jgi:hypothetical protein
VTVTKTQTGTNEDGSPHWNYDYDGPPDGGLLVTGPISGTVVLKDGTAYNVTEPCIEFAPGHDGPILHHVEKMHEAAGTFPDFTHVCTDRCGDEAETPIEK